VTELGALGFLERRSDFQGLQLRTVTELQNPYILFKDHKKPEKTFSSPVPISPERLTYNIGELNVTYGSFWEVKF